MPIWPPSNAQGHATLILNPMPLGLGDSESKGLFAGPLVGQGLGNGNGVGVPEFEEANL